MPLFYIAVDDTDTPLKQGDLLVIFNMEAPNRRPRSLKAILFRNEGDGTLHPEKFGETDTELVYSDLDPDVEEHQKAIEDAAINFEKVKGRSNLFGADTDHIRLLLVFKQEKGIRKIFFSVTNTETGKLPYRGRFILNMDLPNQDLNNAYPL